MAQGKHARRERVVCDKHLDAEAIGGVLGRIGRSAQDFKPSRPYRGEFSHDEDFSDVLQLAWEYEVVLVTADSKMIEKALRFEKQMPRAESCLRGVLVVPRDKSEQLKSLHRFASGEIVAVASRKGDAVPKSLYDVEDYNVALDLRRESPLVVHLCECD